MFACSVFSFSGWIGWRIDRVTLLNSLEKQKPFEKEKSRSVLALNPLYRREVVSDIDLEGGTADRYSRTSVN